MTPKKIICLTPVFNDWESLNSLIDDISQEDIQREEYTFSIVAINDGSSEVLLPELEKKKIEVTIVDLKLNMGHQRAIAVGLQYVLDNKLDSANNAGGHVVVMDGDGEDRPLDIIKMVEKARGKIIFAERVKRSEGFGFRLGYYFYKKLFKLLTGKRISYGNFSAIPFELLDKACVLPNLWNHYASCIAESKIPKGVHPTERGYRYAGKSKMNFSGLIIHGFSSIAIYFDILCFRILKFTFISFFVCSIFIGHVLFQKIFTDNAIPGWASSLILIVLSIIIQLFSVTFIILLLQLRSRKEIKAPDDKFYKKFVKP